MFEQTFVERSDKNRGVSFALSSAGQIVAVCAAVALPLLLTRKLPEVELKGVLLAPRAPVVVAKPKPKESQEHLARGRTGRLLMLSKLFTQVQKPKEAQASDLPAQPVLEGPATLVDGRESSTILLSGMETKGPPHPETAASNGSASSHGPVRLGGRVAEANLIRRVQPVYPPLARATRVEGEVQFAAVIGKTGRIEHLRLLSGHPLLIAAAREAIEQWEYRPVLLNGVPVEVATAITVRFVLGK